MINDDVYLYDAMMNMGEMIDSAVNSANMNADIFIHMFINTGVASQIEFHNPKYTVGKSGAELVDEVLFRTNRYVDIDVEPIDSFSRSPEYWAGWVLEYCQWKSNLSFKKIQELLPVSELIDMYYPLHEASEDKVLNILYERYNSDSHRLKCGVRLQQYRKMLGMSQNDLAITANVNKRTLQQYEIEAKDLAKASAASVLALSRALGCTVEELIS